MSGGNKPDPVARMNVTWIEPSDDPEHASFIKDQLIAIYGRKGLKISSAAKKGEEWVVTLTKNLRPVIEKWPFTHVRQPESWRDKKAEFNWRYLRPV